MRLTIEDKKRIIELKKQGIGHETIAKRFKVAKKRIQTIWYAYELHGLEGIKHPHKNKKYSAEFKLEVINRVFQGESKTRLAAEYNLPGAGTIVLWMKKYIQFP